jgi:L-iditol 2-dehydrogenase
VVIICVGVPELVDQAIDLARNGGRVSIFAGMKGRGAADVSANLIHYKQVVVSGTSNCRRSDYETALSLLSSGKIDAGAMVTHRFGLEQVPEAIAALRDSSVIKAAVMP